MSNVSDEKITLELDKYECGVIFHSLKDKRNQLLKEQQETEAVDDVLMKVIERMEEPQKTERKGRWRREER